MMCCDVDLHTPLHCSAPSPQLSPPPAQPNLLTQQQTSHFLAFRPHNLQDLHKQLEAAISAFHGTQDTILYPSCFDANAGLFEALLGPEDAVLSDELNHASIIDGIRLCKAKRFRCCVSHVCVFVFVCHVCAMMHVTHLPPSVRRAFLNATANHWQSMW